MKKALLIGNFGAGNLGDELILSLALESYPNSVVMTHNPDLSQKFCEKNFETIPFVPTGFRSFLHFIFAPVYRKKILDLRKNKDDFEKIVFCGGGLFSIINRAFILWYVVFLWIKLLFFKKTKEQIKYSEKKAKKTSLIFEYQGIDKPKNKLQKFILKQVFFQADSISVRDKSSGAVLEKIGIKNYEIKTDRVFEFFVGKIKNKRLLKSQEKNQNLRTKDNPKSQNRVLINTLSKKSKNFWNDLKQEIQKKYPGSEMVFVAFEAKDLKFIPKNFTGKVIYPQTKTELLDLFSGAEIVLGQRFHSLVLGKLFAKTNSVLGKPYSQKVQNFCESEGIEVFAG